MSKCKKFHQTFGDNRINFTFLLGTTPPCYQLTYVLLQGATDAAETKDISTRSVAVERMKTKRHNRCVNLKSDDSLCGLGVHFNVRLLT